MPAVRAPLVTLVLLSLLTFALGLGRQAITDGDEGYYAEASREMVESGDWLTPHFNYADRWQKPILYYWASAATFAVAGVSEWGARGFAAASGIALVLLTYAIGLRLLTRKDDAWLGAAIVATCYGYFTLARLALPDLPLALFATLTVYLWLERRPGWAGLAAAMGFLDKGPLALVVPALILMPIAWREHRWKATEGELRPVSFRPGDFALASLVFVVVATPWYAAMFATHGSAYLQSFFIGDNLERFATDRFNSPRALWFYVPIVIGGVFPWTLYLVVLPWTRGIDVIRRRAALTREEWRLIVWTVAPLLFFTASVGKQPRYILPVLPPLALLLAASIGKRVRLAASHAEGSRGLAIATWATAGLYVVLAVLLFRAGPVLINAYPLLSLVGQATFVATAIVLAWTAVGRQWSHLPARMTIGAAGVLLSIQFGALAGIRPEAVETVAAVVRANRSANESIATYQTLQRNLVFYTGLRQVELYDDRQAIDFLRSRDRVLLVAPASTVLRLQQTGGLALKALGSVDYLDPASIRLDTLLFPQSRRDVTDLLVVANQ